MNKTEYIALLETKVSALEIEVLHLKKMATAERAVHSYDLGYMEGVTERIATFIASSKASLQSHCEMADMAERIRLSLLTDSDHQGSE